MNVTVCYITLHFLATHVTPINRPISQCETDAVVYADEAGGYLVTSPMPRPWRVSIDAHGRVTDWHMQGVHQ